uniref:Uncharacterized protein n=1 Tax=Arundo donax TaxID=35708 RepID=A0A0A8YTU4_ARUDO
MFIDLLVLESVNIV